MQAELLVVVDFGLAGSIDGEAGLEGLEVFGRRLDEHIEHEVSLPSNLHNEADGDASVLVGTAEGVDNEEFFVAEFAGCEPFDSLPYVFVHRVVVIGILRSVPPNSIFGVGIHYDVFVFGRASGIDACHYVDCIELGELAFVVAGEGGVHLHLEQLLIRGVVMDFLHAGNA